MIESLAEHGVRPDDLVPALMATHTVKNPEYDPKAAKEAEHQQEITDEQDHPEQDAPPPYEPSAELPDMPAPHLTTTRRENGPTEPSISLPLPPGRPKPINPFGSDDEEDDRVPVTARPSAPTRELSSSSRSSIATSPEPHRNSTFPFGGDDEDDMLPSFVSSSRPATSVTPTKPKASRIPVFDVEDDGGDIGRSASPPPKPDDQPVRQPQGHADDVPMSPNEGDTADHTNPISDPERTPRTAHFSLPGPGEDKRGCEADAIDEKDTLEDPPALPSLPGVSTSLTSADENVVLDIRWTVVSLSVTDSLGTRRAK